MDERKDLKMYVKITKEKIHSGSLVLVCPKYCYHGKPKKLVKHNHSEILLAYDCEKALQNLLKKIRCENKIFLINGYEEQNSTCSSEHQTGLAIDLSLKNSSENPKFPKEGLCEIFR
ncbi:MAG: M15 family metallopeptidase, partial [Bacilli bacterium]|nr:M15 family metallopeptidase [Bacilli bacterium]